MLTDGLPTSNQITLTLRAIWDPRYIASRNTGKLRTLTAKPWRQIQTTPLPKPGSPPPCRKTVNAALHSRRLTFPSAPTENRQSRRPRVEELLLNDAGKRRKTSSTPFGVPPNRRQRWPRRRAIVFRTAARLRLGWTRLDALTQDAVERGMAPGNRQSASISPILDRRAASLSSRLG